MNQSHFQVVAELDALQAEVDALKRPQALLDHAFKGELEWH